MHCEPSSLGGTGVVARLVGVSYVCHELDATHTV